jgi:hypothetical protein
MAMKTPQKAAPANTKQSQPANQQASKDNFFSATHEAEQAKESPFFEGNRVQRKMTVNEPRDHFEKQADQVADKVVQHINQPKAQTNSAPGTATAGATNSAPATASTPSVQKKDDKKEDKQEKEQSSGDKELQRRPIFESDGDPNEGNTLKRSSQAAVPDVSPQTQQKIESSKGGGEPLPANTREDMEGAMGTDLSGVRIHNNSEAAGLSRDLQAQAFTHGNDIYFDSGKYDTQSASGQHLLAHEVAHTVQQGGGGVQKKAIQRAAAPSPGAITAAAGEKATKDDPIDNKKKILYVPSINIPAVKYAMMPGGSKANYNFNKVARSGAHLDKWNNAAKASSTFTGEFNKKKAKEIPSDKGKPNFFMTLESEKHHNSLSHIITGDAAAIQANITRPFWDESGKNVESGYDVDHKVELQLGGLDDTPNLWLLEAATNRSSGGNINTEIDNKIADSLEKITTMPDGQKKPSAAVVRENYTITAGKILGTLGVAGSGKGWELSDIEASKHLKGLAFLSSADQAKFKFTDSTELSLITSERFGKTLKIPDWVPGNAPGAKGSKAVNRPIGPIKSKGADLEIKKIDYIHQDNPTILSTGSVGTAYIDVLKNDKHVKGISLLPQPIDALPGFYGGRLNKAAVKTALSAQLTAKGLSPIKIEEIDIDPDAGLVGFGKITTDVPFIKGAEIDIFFDSDGIKIRKVFNSGELKVPPPFKVSNTSLEVYAATSGVGVKGIADFEIKGLGKGQVGAKANSSGEFALDGTFDFDSKTFNPAQIKASYANGEFSASGEIGIPAGKVKGLKSANIKIDYAKNVFNASGTAEPDIKGIKSAEIHVTYGNEQLVIGGSFVLDENIPGIQSGSGSVEVTRGPDEIYHVKANGTAVPKIPKIN